jgi:hypothetical protein
MVNCPWVRKDYLPEAVRQTHPLAPMALIFFIHLALDKPSGRAHSLQCPVKQVSCACPYCRLYDMQRQSMSSQLS